VKAGGGYSNIQRHEGKHTYLCLLFFHAHSDKGVFTEYQGEGEWLLRIRRLSPRYGVPLLPFAQPEVWSSHLLSPRYGVPICSARGMEFPFAQPEVWSSSITICSARGTRSTSTIWVPHFLLQTITFFSFFSSKTKTLN
jgi:hypothetical protein